MILSENDDRMPSLRVGGVYRSSVAKRSITMDAVVAWRRAARYHVPVVVVKDAL